MDIVRQYACLGKLSYSQFIKLMVIFGKAMSQSLFPALNQAITDDTALIAKPDGSVQKVAMNNIAASAWAAA